jgi:Protein of unknown function (DUF1279)
VSALNRLLHSRPITRNYRHLYWNESSSRIWQPQHHHHHWRSCSASSTPDDRTVSDRLRDKYHERSQAFRESVDDRREALRTRATHYRDSAASKIREFRENPQQTARDGAKSFTTMMRTYGPVFIGTYLCVYVTTLSGCYLGVASGALDPVSLFSTLGIASADAATSSTVDLVYNFLDHHEITKAYAHYVQDYPQLANFGVAWISVKFTEPIRLPIAISITPQVARYIGYRPKENESENIHKETPSSSPAPPSSSSSSSTPAP